VQLNVTGTRNFDLLSAAEYFERDGGALGMALRRSKLDVWEETDTSRAEQYRMVMEDMLADQYAGSIVCACLTVPDDDEFFGSLEVVQASYYAIFNYLKNTRIPDLEWLGVEGAPPEQVARDLRDADVSPREWNGVWLRSYSERCIAEALDRANVFFVANATARLGITQDHRTNSEPDFLVVCDGKTGILEVNGPQHTADADHERARLLKQHGIAVVEPFTANECRERPDAVVEEFLRLLRLNG
jgi:hypothetical protein